MTIVLALVFTALLFSSFVYFALGDASRNRAGSTFIADALSLRPAKRVSRKKLPRL